jgi:hypothetical protein
MDTCVYPIEGTNKHCGKPATQSAPVAMTMEWNPSGDPGRVGTLWTMELCDEHYEIVKSQVVGDEQGSG